MHCRSIASIFAAVMVASFCVCGGTPTYAQNKHDDGGWDLERLPGGQPDLQGVWLSKSATPLQRPELLQGRNRLTDEEVRRLRIRAERLFTDGDGSSEFAAGDNLFLAVLSDVDHYSNPRSTCNSLSMIEREFDNRTSLIVDPPDGRIPEMTSSAQRRQQAVSLVEMNPPGPEMLSPWVRCITRGLPRLGGTSGAGVYGYYQIFQTEEYVVLFMETIHDARIIPIGTSPHISQTIRQWHGDSRGWWEEDTLVVETTNFSVQATVLGSDENLHLIERFTRTSEETITYEVTMTDETVWATPWTVRLPLTYTSESIYEFACHEGNHYGMIGILAGARAQESSTKLE